MGISRQLCKSYFNDFIHQSNFNFIEQTSRSFIYKNCDEVIIVTDDSSKMIYYMYAKENKYKYIPKIKNMLYDWQNNLYFIQREILYPCTDTKKLAKIDKMKLLVSEGKSCGPLTEELLAFRYSPTAMKYEMNFDFGPHWLMETNNGKIVVADAFTSDYNGLLNVC